MYCWFEIGRYCDHSFLVRINIDHIAAVTDCGINISFRVYDPPKIAIELSAESAVLTAVQIASLHFIPAFRTHHDIFPPILIVAHCTNRIRRLNSPV